MKSHVIFLHVINNWLLLNQSSLRVISITALSHGKETVAQLQINLKLYTDPTVYKLIYLLWLENEHSPGGLFNI